MVSAFLGQIVLQLTGSASSLLTLFGPAVAELKAVKK